MPKYWPLALVVLVLLMACGGGSKPAKPATSVAAPDAANATYVIEGKNVTLAGGKLDEPAAPGSASRNVTMLTTYSAAGDLDGDGKADLAVVLTSSPGGSGTFYYVAALTSSSSQPAKAIALGDRVSISQVSISSGAVTVSYLMRPDGAPFTATPSVPVSKTFKLVGGQLAPS